MRLIGLALHLLLLVYAHTSSRSPLLVFAFEWVLDEDDVLSPPLYADVFPDAVDHRHDD